MPLEVVLQFPHPCVHTRARAGTHKDALTDVCTCTMLLYVKTHVLKLIISLKE